MILTENSQLKYLNTFHVEAHARFFCEVSSPEEIRAVLQEKKFRKTPKLVLGGGSNVLFTKDFDGLVIKNSITGISLINEDKNFYYVKAGAGENWHKLVMHCIEKNYAGIENLSLIPGCAGAAPIQNIGAYGVELKDVFHELEAINMTTGREKSFSASNCKFGYRDSVFKNKEKGKYIITSITLQLRKKPVFNTSYGAIGQELEKMGVQELSIAAISKAVCSIRSAKLPNPDELGNAGSFFKNPVLSTARCEELKKEFPSLVAYKNSETDVKLAAGWLVEKCGWKGKRFGDAGVHRNQALVLVNYGKAKGKEILELSEKIAASVKKKFGIDLEREVNIL